MRNLLRSILSTLATTIYECADGAEALDSFRQHRPDCVLMDIKMEQTDGISATRQILDSFPDAIVVIVTDYDDVELRDAAREAGATEYVVKENLLHLDRILNRLIKPNQLATR